ncbi:hypothetical protein HMPREF0043_01323 [Actinobaculum sp. oral taxon 183 str. F0552]|nr:hypothetical protein HMPREF0043_01323 [Actinobaculum sp. oral taxon 183 str. F0552]
MNVRWGANATPHRFPAFPIVCEVESGTVRSNRRIRSLHECLKPFHAIHWEIRVLRGPPRRGPDCRV